MEEGHFKPEIYKVSFLFFILILLATSVSAFSVINIYVDEAGSSLFLGQTDGNISLPEGISVKNGEIVGTTNLLTEKKGDSWTFSYSLEDSELSLFLPENAKTTNASVGEFSVEGGRIRVDVSNSIEIGYVLGDKPASFPARSYFIVLLIIAVIISVIYYMKEHKSFDKETKRSEGRIKRSDKMKILQNILSDRQNVIIDKLRESGRIKSSQLRRLCEMPKASFSRHLQELEKKGLIRRTGDGKNKFVELKR